MLYSVMWVCLCIPGHIHCSCSTVMALLCIPVSELVLFLQSLYDPSFACIIALRIWENSCESLSPGFVGLQKPAASGGSYNVL